ncbi:hypothetical protein AAF712_003572 [Marasmius tenuissimus]|uniref:Uncharacterized protein n=1 Tax=Marasmius tenuissimus TaxID=585030 RepID=A0ABR3A7C1_9AGAR
MSNANEEVEDVENQTLHELVPSIVNVERTLLMTLNNLLSGTHRWRTIVPERRHSMPTSPQSSTAPRLEFESTSSALQILVENLRSQTQDECMEQKSSSQTNTELISELRARVDDISSTLESSDVELIRAVIMLLSHLNRLSILLNTSSPKTGPLIHSQSFTALNTPTDNVFDTLKRQLSDFQVERLTSGSHDVVPTGSKPVVAVEAALLWSKIDEELETVVSMCRERTEQLPRFPTDHLPPQYDSGDYDEKLPEYDYESRSLISYDGEKSRSQSAVSPAVASNQSSEKRRLDFEAVTMAIDRLYLVAQMEKARKEGTQSAKARGKQKEKENDVRDLEKMLELIGKASDRTIKDQSVILDGGMKVRLERARQRDNEKASACISARPLSPISAEHSDAGRLHDQDAVLQPRVKDPHALLTLPEFIREAIPADSQQLRDPQAMLTLPEFVREMPPPHVLAKMKVTPPTAPTNTLSRLKKKSRDRSSSAPPLASPLAWLTRSSSKSNLTSDVQELTEHNVAMFEVNYLAEFHENLQHVLIFFTCSGAHAGVDIVAEVVPSSSGSSLDDEWTEHFLTAPLPGRVTSGKKEVKVQSGHYEIKLQTLPSSPMEHRPLLDATQLSTEKPTTFICASCSLPIVQSNKVHSYRDLPSEHWEELVDAWMCHPSQKLHDDVVQRSKSGFWPEPGYALVGGSYILFEESAMTRDNVHSSRASSQRTEGGHVVRCICGAIVGRCQEHKSKDANITAYRVLKYAVRPVSPSAEPTRIPLSAFVVEDMTEFVHAHASYRFVLSDEEEERPRILIWLFKPSLQLSYTAQRPYAIPKSASTTVAKVLFKLLGPSEGQVDIKNILSKYPGFPQAEYLYYPMDTCQRLAVLLKESNRTYPEDMRLMTGLEVGWLQRS